MRTNQTIKKIVWVMGVVLLLSGCTKVSSDNNDGKARINFASPTIKEEIHATSFANRISSGAITRATLTEKTTVRVVAFTSTNPTYSGDQAYFVDSEGKLRPCTVNDDGSFKAVDTENELALYPNTYDFYAYTPAVPLGANKNSVTVPNGIDYASSVTSSINVTADQTLALTQLDRKCAKIALVVKAGADNTLMTALSVASEGVKINNLPAAVTVGLNKPIAQASGTTIHSVPQSAFKTVSATETSAITYLLPRLGTNRMKIDYNLTYTVSGAYGSSETKTVSGTIGNTILDGSKSYTFTLTMRQAGASLTVADWIESNQDVNTGESFDYSIDGSSGFIMAAGDAKNPIDGTVTMNWYQANGVIHSTNRSGQKACPTGWRVPTSKELQLLWIYNSAIPANIALNTNGFFVWSNDEFDASNGWYNGFLNGSTYYALKTELHPVRCVRNIAPMSNPFQKVVITTDNRVVIDSRSVRSAGITSQNKAQTTKSTNSTTSNPFGMTDIASKESNAQVHYYFEVAKSDSDVGAKLTWLDAINKCASLTNNGGGWRLPTQRELMLMWVLKPELENKLGSSFIADRYWCALEWSDISSWFIDFSSGITSNPGKTQLYHVRCVRDLTPPTN